MNEHAVLNLLSIPIWIVSPTRQEIIFANDVAKELSSGADLEPLRNGKLSVHAEDELEAYIPSLLAGEQIVELWTIRKAGKSIPLNCRLSLLKFDSQTVEILVEGLSQPQIIVPTESKQSEGSFYEVLFHSNSAPMLLIDPSQDGQIIDANPSAVQFYGYSRDTFCRMHTWEINSLGREVLPIMHEVAKLPGGHKPLNFVHRLADGSIRDVQTYAGPIELDGRRLMLCIIHDVTMQKRLKNELEQAASRDHLTGLWNRRYFLQILESAHRQKRRYDLDYSLLLLDVDHFKCINDQHGHSVGDAVLVMLAKTFEARARETDTVCRWGGEEFVVLLPQTDLENAARLAECLRLATEQLRMPHLPSITISIGVAQNLGEETTENLLKRADMALYRAKELGRNRVAVA